MLCPISEHNTIFKRKHNIYIAESAREGRETLKKHSIDFIFTDQRMPEITGVEFLESIINDYPDVMRILITGYSDITAVIDAINKGCI